jgi:hypothetical protein
VKWLSFIRWPGRSSAEFARFDRLFAEAERKSAEGLDQIFNGNATLGRLKSGATIKAGVDTIESMTAFAIRESLAGISSVTQHSGRRRRIMVAQLRKALDTHQQRQQALLDERFEKIGLASDLRHAQSRIDAASHRHEAMLDDYSQGWTAPADKPWNERHPLYFAIVVALASAALGAIATALLTQ